MTDEAWAAEKAAHVIEVRNLFRFSASQITCDVLHEHHGWIPFSALLAEIDSNEYTAAVFAYIKANKIKISKLEECPTVKARSETVAKLWRNGELSRADVIINKIEDFEIEGDSKVWRQYRVALRNWPSVEGFPSDKSKPVAPDA